MPPSMQVLKAGKEDLGYLMHGELKKKKVQE